MCTCTCTCTCMSSFFVHGSDTCTVYISYIHCNYVLHVHVYTLYMCLWWPSYVCIYMYMYVQYYMYMYVYMHMHVHVLCMYMYLYMYTMYIHVRVYTCTWTSTYVLVHCACTYTQCIYNVQCTHDMHTCHQMAEIAEDFPPRWSLRGTITTLSPHLLTLPPLHHETTWTTPTPCLAPTRRTRARGPNHPSDAPTQVQLYHMYS